MNKIRREVKEDYDEKRDYTPQELSNELVMACQKGNVPRVKRLLGLGADPNSPGFMPKDEAIEFGEFIQKGGKDKINKAISWDNTKNSTTLDKPKMRFPLFTAIWVARKNPGNLGMIMRGRRQATLSQCTQIVKLLLKHKADPNVLTPMGNAAIAPCRQVSIAKSLKKAGADFTIVSFRNYTGLHWAAREGNLEMVRFLTEEPITVTTEYKETTRLLVGSPMFKAFPIEILVLIVDFTTVSDWLTARGMLIESEGYKTALQLAEKRYAPLTNPTGVYMPDFDGVINHLRAIEKWRDEGRRNSQYQAALRVGRVDESSIAP